MLNIPKENVKAFVGIIVGVAVLIIISLIIDVNYIHRSVFHKAEPDMTQYSNTPESKVEENKYNIVSEERRVLYYTDEIMDMINKKEFDKLYNILDEKYRSLYVESVADLEESMSRFADGEYSLTYNKYYKEGNMFLIDAYFEKVNITRDDIINGGIKPFDTICIKESEKGKYTVAFNGFISKKDVIKEDSNSLVRVKVQDMLLKADSTELLIYVENKTDEKITLYDDRLDIYLAHNGIFKYVNPNTISKELEPGGKTIFNLQFKNMYSKDSAAKSLRFNRIYGANGKIEDIEIKLQ